MEGAQLDLAFARPSDRTALERRVFRWPFVVMRPFYLDRSPAHMATVIVQSSSGAVQGDDHLRQIVRVGARAAAHVTTQGAGPVHRATPGSSASETVTIAVEDGGYLEYLPEPRLLFPGADFEQKAELSCARTGALLFCDAFTTKGPDSCHDDFRRFRSTITLRVGDDRLVAIDRTDIRGLGARADGVKAFATMILAAPGRLEAGAELAATLNQDFQSLRDLYAAASPLPGDSTGIAVRLAGCDLRAVRSGIAAAWSSIRQGLFGKTPPSRRKDETSRAITRREGLT